MRSSCDARAPSVRFASASIVIVVIVCLYIANKYLLNEMERTIVSAAYWSGMPHIKYLWSGVARRAHDCLLAASGAPLPLLPYHCSAMCLWTSRAVPLPPVLIWICILLFYTCFIRSASLCRAALTHQLMPNNLNSTYVTLSSLLTTFITI